MTGKRRYKPQGLDKHTQADVRWVLHEGEHHARLAHRERYLFCQQQGFWPLKDPEPGSPRDAPAPVCRDCLHWVEQMPIGETFVMNRRRSVAMMRHPSIT